MKSRPIPRTLLLMVLCVGALVGLGLARTSLGLPTLWIWLSSILVAVTFRRRRLGLLISVALFGITIGWWRGSNYLPNLAPYQELATRKVVVSGRADSDGVYANNGQLSFDLSDVTVIEPDSQQLVGKMTVSGYGATAVYRGDIVQAEGKLYPTRGSRQARISYADIAVQGRSQAVIESVRRRFVAGMQTALPEPLASFGLGLLVGQRSTLPDTVTDQLSMVGLTHIVAVSGYNLTILVQAARRIGGKRSKYQTTVLAALLIAVFLLFTGFSASIVRASIVSGLSLLAWYYGRTIRPLLLILLAAAGTALWYPFYLWSDIGWYLSFLAFYGVLIVAPLVTRRFYRSSKQPKLLSSVLTESISAQLMTLPLIMYIFKEFSLIAVVANVLVVPFVPIAMLLSLVAGVAGMLAPMASGWFAWPARIILLYMLDIVNILSRVPHALLRRSLSLAQLVALYGGVVGITAVLWHKTTPKHGIITDTKGS